MKFFKYTKKILSLSLFLSLLSCNINSFLPQAFLISGCLDMGEDKLNFKKENYINSEIPFLRSSDYTLGIKKPYLKNDGSFVFSWSFNYQGYVETFNNKGVKEEDPVKIVNQFNNPPSTITYDKKGNFIASWDYYGEIFLRKFLKKGKPIDDGFKLKNENKELLRDIGAPQVIIDNKGDYII